MWGWVPDWEAGTEAAAARYRAGTGVAVAVAGSRRVVVRHCLLTTDASTALCRHSSQPPPPPAAAAAGRHGNPAASSSSSSAGCHAGRGTAAGRHGQRGGGDRQQLEKRGQSLRLRRTKASHQHQQLSITHGHARTHAHTHTYTETRALAGCREPAAARFTEYFHDDLTTISQQGTKVRRYSCSLGWPFPTIKYLHIFQIKYTEAILSNSTRNLLWFEITKRLIAV